MCRWWRDTALNTASLWSTVHISQGNVASRLEALPVFIDRSKGHLLNLQLECFWNQEVTESVISHLKPYSNRWKNLDILALNTDVLSLLNNIAVPSLESLKISHFSARRNLAIPSEFFGGHLPNLSTLILRNICFQDVKFSLSNLTLLEIRGLGNWPEYSELREALGGEASCLERFVLHVKPSLVLEQVQRGGNSPIHLPRLRSLDILTSEWLSSDISSLARLFSYPAIQHLSVQACSGSATTFGQDIVHYTTLPIPTGVASDLPKMSVQSSSMFLAWALLSPELRLSTLELTAATWPSYPRLAEMFAGMPLLQKLVLNDINPTVALGVIVGDGRPAISVPTLRHLEISVSLKSFYQISAPDVARLVRLFALPNLTSLVLRNMSADQWKCVVASFRKYTTEYPCLQALTLANMSDIIGSDSVAAVAFPLIRQLNLIQVGANPIIKCLLTPGHWPDLETITICGDINASKPLLHRVLTTREAAGQPLTKLFLDQTFSSNLESWGWLHEHVEIVDIPKI